MPRDDPERLAADHRRVALDVLAGRLALEHARGAGEEAEVVGGERHLVARGHERLADVQRLELRELLGVLLHHVRERVQQLRAVLRRLLRPRRPAPAGPPRPRGRRPPRCSAAPSAIVSPVAGAITSIVSPDALSTNSPPMKHLVRRRRRAHLMPPCSDSQDTGVPHQPLRERDGDDRHHDHRECDRVHDGQLLPEPDVAEDQQRQRVLRARREVRDDDLVERQREREQPTRDQRGREDRPDDEAERLPARRRRGRATPRSATATSAAAVRARCCRRSRCRTSHAR